MCGVPLYVCVCVYVCVPHSLLCIRWMSEYHSVCVCVCMCVCPQVSIRLDTCVVRHEEPCSNAKAENDGT